MSSFSPTLSMIWAKISRGRMDDLCGMLNIVGRTFGGQPWLFERFLLVFIRKVSYDHDESTRLWLLCQLGCVSNRGVANYETVG